MTNKKTHLLAIIGPGILVAATGVGAGDLATGAMAGSKLGLAVLWVVVVGTGLKFLLNEGLARWQLATGRTLLEGCVAHFGQPVSWLFLAYLLVWSFLVGSALMSACGVTAHAMLPLFTARTDKVLYGVLHSAVAVGLVRVGGYRLFAKVMSVCIGVMVVVVVATAVAMMLPLTGVGEVFDRPALSLFRGEGLAWTIALMGGVGGTVTVLCYGYWIQEEGRRGTEDLGDCRIDLACGYAMTALFGLGMVVIGRSITVTGGGATLVVDLAHQLETALGPVGPAAKWAFLVGAWGAVFSSLLGVWQSVPYLFADFWNLVRATDEGARTRRGGVPAERAVDTRSRPYQIYLFGLASIPMAGLLWMSFERAQLVYSVVGALFIPMLALALLILNGQSRWVGPGYRNSRLTTLLLLGALAFFLLAGWLDIQGRYHAVFG